MARIDGYIKNVAELDKRITGADGEIEKLRAIITKQESANIAVQRWQVLSGIK